MQALQLSVGRVLQGQSQYTMQAFSQVLTALISAIGR